MQQATGMTADPGRDRALPATPPTIAVVGATATGKTAFAVRLARAIGSAELVNADSRQVLRGLHVGTNRPGSEDLEGVACHLLGITDPGTPFSVADWLMAARACLASLDLRGARPIVVGGTGLYVRALLDGLELGGAPPDPVHRAALNARAASPEGLAELAGELRRRDTEIVETRGSLAGRARRGNTRPSVRIGLQVAPELHRGWITARARTMLTGGLLEETAAALAGGVPPEALDASGIGYREAMAVLDGKLSEAAAAAEIVRRTARYAKAQLTWFRADPSVVWLRRERGDDVADLVTRAVALIEAA